MAIIVLGMHRSGTSAVTGLVAGMGAWTGPEDMLLPASPDNPMGFFERSDVLALNRAILKSHNCNWYQLGNFDPKRPLPPELAGPMRRIASELAEHTPYVLKDPRLCLTLPYWLPFFPVKPLALLATRHPLAIAESLASRNGMSHAHALALWEFHMVHALNALNSERLRVVRSNYEQMISHTDQAVKSLHHALNGYFPTLRLPDSDILDKRLAHFSGQGTLTPKQWSLYEIATGQQAWKGPLTLTAATIELIKSMPTLPQP